MVRAVVYIPPDLPMDGRYAEECEAFVAGEDWELAGIMRDWDTVEWLLREHRADVIVFYHAPSRGVRVEWPTRDIGERVTTLRLRAGRVRRDVNRESQRWTTGDVRKALYGNMPVHGANRTTVEALRRIADHLQECFGGDS